MARKAVKKAKRATWNRDMYPGVRFCEKCFAHHNKLECDFPGMDPNDAEWEQVDMLGTWRKKQKEEVA